MAIRDFLMSGTLQSIGADIHNLPNDLSEGSAQQNLMDLERTNLDTEATPVDARKLCILGLPWDTTDEELQTYFAGFGPLEVYPFPLSLSSLYLNAQLPEI